jgi:hypothetical protein
MISQAFVIKKEKKVPKNLVPSCRRYGAMEIYKFRKRIPVNRASQLSHLYAKTLEQAV